MLSFSPFPLEFPWHERRVAERKRMNNESPPPTPPRGREEHRLLFSNRCVVFCIIFCGLIFLPFGTAKVVKECDLAKYTMLFYIKKVKEGRVEMIIL